MASIRTEHGVSTLHGAAKRMEFEIALTRLQYKTFNIMMSMDLQKEMKAQESEIITDPIHGGNGKHRKPFTR